MNTRILIKNQEAGGQTAEFPVERFHELTIGRDGSCDLKYDPNNDLVSRRHAKISQSGAADYTIADLGSRNGTFVNHQRIFGPVSLHSGDTVQLGPGGPEFEFDLDPPPAAMVRPTRLADDVVIASSASPTREAVPVNGSPVPVAAQGPVPAPATVGRATVERLIHQTEEKGRRNLYMVLGAVAVILIAVGGWLYFARPKQTTIVQRIEQKMAPDGLTPTQIAQNNTDATVEFEVGWKLVDTDTGKQLFHRVIPNRQKVVDKNGKPVKGKDGKEKEEEIVPGAGDFLPVFFVVENNRLEPLLTTDDGGGKNYPIGGRHFGSGFVVSSDGFILTNRHVAAAWHSSYGFTNEQVKAGVVLVREGEATKKIPITNQQFPRYWVPAQAKFVTADGGIQQLPTVVPKGKTLEGRNDYLDVAFAKNRIRIPAKISRISDRMDVAMVKIEIPQALKKVELNDNWDTIKVGDPTVVLGYPGVSSMAPVMDVAASKDVLNQAPSIKEVADPTLSSGNIARIVRGQVTTGEGQYFGGDFYQLTINSTGHGNSGGPMFDSQGRVIGIFTLGWSDNAGANVTGAIPIRYGMELMGVHPAGK